MKYLIDTSSLLILTRYYLPFDSNVILPEVQSRFASGEFTLVRNVYNESRNVARGIILKKMPFLSETPQEHIPESDISPKHHKIMDNNWAIGDEKSKITSGEYAKRKSMEIENNADFQLVLRAMRDRANYTVVTEETVARNDGKLFKKIPLICKQQGVACITLPEMLRGLGLRVGYKWGCT